jgi:hypothetical protein
MIRQGIGAGEGLTITVKGSPVLFEALKQHMDDDMLAFRHVATDDIDLTVEMGEAVLVTRMAAWSETVRKVLA